MTTSQRKPRRSQAERSAASSTAILNAAVELFFEEGTRASMSEIGRRSGFSHGLVMARFGSKDGLIVAVSHEIHRRFRVGVFALLEGKRGLGALHAFIDAYCDSLIRNSGSTNAFLVLLGEALSPNHLLREAFAALDHLVRDVVGAMIEEAKADGEICGKVSTEGTAILMFAMLRGLGVQARINPEAVDIDIARKTAHALLGATFRSRADSGQENVNS